MRASIENPTTLGRPSSALNRLDPVMSTSQQLGFVVPEEIDMGVSIYEHVGRRYSGDLAPIRLIISQGTEDLTIKVSDEAGGICRSDWSKLWDYSYTTDTSASKGPVKGFRDQFSGGGYGLPIARLFARYFGGEITIISMEGYGTDAFIQVHKLGKNMEVVPGHASYCVEPLKY